jgi:hypothetical protein
MNKWLTYLAIILLWLSTSLPLEAKVYPFIFWYPGGEGTALQAKPILTAFTDYLNARTPKDQKFRPQYISDVASGKKIIREKNVSVGIVSLPIYLESTELTKVKLLLQTLPLPEKNGTEHFYLLAHRNASLSPYDSAVYSPRPYPTAFLKNVIFSNNPAMASAKLIPTETILNTLKKVGQEELKAYILVNSFEYETVKHLDASWAQQLSVISISPPLPTSPMVIFHHHLLKNPLDNLIPILLKMPQDPEGKEILETLRLNGFKVPDLKIYQKWEKVWSN